MPPVDADLRLALDRMRLREGRPEMTDTEAADVARPILEPEPPPMPASEAEALAICAEQRRQERGR